MNKDIWKGLRAAAGHMQVDNGYSHEAAVLSAVALAVSQTHKANPEFTLDKLDAAETWCLAQTDEILEIACTGEDITPNDTTGAGMLMCRRNLAGDIDVQVAVPPDVALVLNWLFDRI